MASPIKPKDFEAVTIKPGDSLRVRIFKAWVKFPILLYKWHKWAFDSDGTITSQFKEEICKVKCTTSTT